MLHGLDAGGIALREIGVELVVAHVFRKGSVKIVGAALHGHVEDAAAGQPQRGVRRGRGNFEFLDAVYQRSELPFAGSGVDGSAIQVELVAAGGATVHGQAAVGVPSARAGEPAGAELLLGKDHAGGELRQHEHLAAVERQFADALVVHKLAQHGAFGIDGGQLGSDRHVLAERAHYQANVDGRPVAHRESDSLARELLESRSLADHRVGSGRDLREYVAPIGGTGGGDTDVGIEVGRLDGGPRNCGARRIGHLARYQGPELLCTGKRTEEHGKHDQTEAHFSPHPPGRWDPGYPTYISFQVRTQWGSRRDRRVDRRKRLSHVWGRRFRVSIEFSEEHAKRKKAPASAGALSWFAKNYYSFTGAPCS